MASTGWESFAEENSTTGGLVFGYKAPANKKVLQGLPATSVLLEVRNANGSFCRLTDLKNKDKETFAPGQWLAILDSKPLVGQINRNFKAFEKALEEKMDKYLPDNRFDKFVDWSDPRAWTKKKGGYSLDISHLSTEKRNDLIANFTSYGCAIKNGQLSVTSPKWVEVLEFEWKMAGEQRASHKNTILGTLTKSSTQIRTARSPKLH